MPPQTLISELLAYRTLGRSHPQARFCRSRDYRNRTKEPNLTQGKGEARTDVPANVTNDCKMNSPGWEAPNTLPEKSGEVTPERGNRWGQSKNSAQGWMCLVMEVKSDAVKSNVA